MLAKKVSMQKKVLFAILRVLMSLLTVIDVYKRQQEELAVLQELILSNLSKVRMIILYGSCLLYTSRCV